MKAFKKKIAKVNNKCMADITTILPPNLVPTNMTWSKDKLWFEVAQLNCSNS